MIAHEKLLEKINSLPPGKIDEVADFVDFLAARESMAWRVERTASIAAYAAEFAGTEFDLDEPLEAASVDCLLAINEDRN